MPPTNNNPLDSNQDSLGDVALAIIKNELENAKGELESIRNTLRGSVEHAGLVSRHERMVERVELLTSRIQACETKLDNINKFLMGSLFTALLALVGAVIGLLK